MISDSTKILIKQAIYDRVLSVLEFYGNLVHKFRKNIGKYDFSGQVNKVVICYKRKGYNIDVIKQSAFFAVDPITVDHFAYLFNCTLVGRGSNSMIAPT